MAVPPSLRLLIGSLACASLSACGGKIERDQTGDESIVADPGSPPEIPVAPISDPDPPVFDDGGSMDEEEDGRVWKECPEGSFPAAPVEENEEPACLQGWLLHVQLSRSTRFTDVAVTSDDQVIGFGTRTDFLNGKSAAFLYTVDALDGAFRDSAVLANATPEYSAGIWLDDEDEIFLSTSPSWQIEGAENEKCKVRRAALKGSPRWSQDIELPFGEEPFARSIQGHDGVIYVLGSVLRDTEGDFDIWVASFDAETGEQKDVHFFETEGRQIPSDLLIGDDGTLYIGGFTDTGLSSRQALGGTDAILISMTPSGIVNWSHEGGGGPLNGLTWSPHGLLGAGSSAFHVDLDGFALFAPQRVDKSSADSVAVTLNDFLWITGGQSTQSDEAYADWGVGGGSDISFTLREMTTGTELARAQFGSAEYDHMTAMASLSEVDHVLAGLTHGPVGGIPTEGEPDGLLARVRLFEEELEVLTKE